MEKAASCSETPPEALFNACCSVLSIVWRIERGNFGISVVTDSYVGRLEVIPGANFCCFPTEEFAIG